MDDASAQRFEAATLPAGRFAGREAFRQVIRDALANAAREGWREIIMADATFEDWPLGERAVAQALQDWSKSGRSCVLLARRWDAAVRMYARFVTWRRAWSHIVDARACRAADVANFPSAIWTPSWVMERRDLERCTGYAGHEPDRRVALRENLGEWLGKSSPSFPAVTLGL
jgi:hypothetical protein